MKVRNGILLSSYLLLILLGVNMAFLENISATENPTVFLLGGNPAALGDDRALIFDAVLSENTNFSSTITSHPISKGRTISDHIVSNNISFSFRCIISDHPIPNDQVDPKNTITKDNSPAGSSKYGDQRKFRTDAAYRTLVSIDKSKKPFTIVTSHATYPNCVIKSMTFNKNTLAQLDVTLNIERLRIVTTDVAAEDLKIVEKDISDDLGSKKQKGQGKITDFRDPRSISQGFVRQALGLPPFEEGA